MTPEQKVKQRQINEKIARALLQRNLLYGFCYKSFEHYKIASPRLGAAQVELDELEDEQENFYRHVLKRRK